jgi:peptidoglycan-associated lipoprotein
MRRWLACSIPLVLMAACAHKETRAEPVEAAAVSSPLPVEAPVARAERVQRSCSSDAECGSRQLCIQSHCTDITSSMAECRDVQVHFAFDRADLNALELPLLQRASRCLMSDTGEHVVIEGDADERGTVEYNLALGDRRANAVQNYLRNLGVSSEQLKTMSYGKEKPLCTEHTENCWAQNRRAAVEARP